MLASTWWVLNARTWFRGPRFGYGDEGAADEEVDPKGALGDAKDADAAVAVAAQ